MSSSANPYHVYTSKYLFAKIKFAIQSVLKTNPQIKTVLDAPAGAGALTHFLFDECKLEVTAAEYDPSKWKVAGVPIVQADMSRSLPFEDNKFDMVVCLEGIKHTTDALTCVKECVRVLKPGGYFFITIPNDLNLQSRLRYLFDGFVDMDWKHPLLPGSEDDKNFLYPGCQVSLPYLYYHLEKSKMQYITSYACHYRTGSLLLYILLFPFILFYTAKACYWGKHPLFKILLSPVWQTGKRNILVYKKTTAF